MIFQRCKRRADGNRTAAGDSVEVWSFKGHRDFRRWLADNHDRSAGIWLRVYKKHSRTASITYPEALDQALCFGWIDGQRKSLDEESWLQKFTPRRPRSGWSKRNTEHAQRLIESKQMRPAGLKEIEAAKDDGRWAAAYVPFREARVPNDFLRALAANKKAEAFYKTLNRTNVYSIVYRLQTAKTPQTRQKRLSAIIEKLERGEKFH